MSASLGHGAQECLTGDNAVATTASARMGHGVPQTMLTRCEPVFGSTGW